MHAWCFAQCLSYEKRWNPVCFSFLLLIFTFSRFYNFSILLCITFNHSSPFTTESWGVEIRSQNYLGWIAFKFRVIYWPLIEISYEDQYNVWALCPARELNETWLIPSQQLYRTQSKPRQGETWTQYVLSGKTHFSVNIPKYLGQWWPMGC